MERLLIKTKQGEVYESRLPMHFMVAEEHEVDLDNVQSVGFVTKGREIWMDRRPH